MAAVNGVTFPPVLDEADADFQAGAQSEAPTDSAAALANGTDLSPAMSRSPSIQNNNSQSRSRKGSLMPSASFSSLQNVTVQAQENAGYAPTASTSKIDSMVLEFEDGTAYEGVSFGAQGKSVSGECVFQTGQLYELQHGLILCVIVS